ncbi:MAG: xanthine dehydrogenase family protein subunit M [Anaerolineales bacterium]|jgi:4-hydroxybenzoyl-CoA reductase subunit beta
MMRLPPFEYLTPNSLAEAVEMKAKYDSEAMYVSGGTDLYPKMKRRQFTPKVLISLNRIDELRRLSNGDGMTLGAGLTLTEVANHLEIGRHYSALARAAGLVSSPPLRNVGTIGGNLCVDTRCTYYDQTYQWRKALGFCLKKSGDTCWVALSSPRCMAVASSDCAPVAIALDAQVRLVGPEGERIIPVSALYNNDGVDYLLKSPDEILVSIHLPNRDGWRMAYWKMRRRGSIDFPILGVAVVLRLDVEGSCRAARIVLGAVASQPLIANEAASLLVGKRITPELVQLAADEAYKLAKPLDNTDMALGYRKKMTRVYIARALSKAAGLSQGG